MPLFCVCLRFGAVELSSNTRKSLYLFWARPSMYQMVHKAIFWRVGNAKKAKARPINQRVRTYNILIYNHLF